MKEGSGVLCDRGGTVRWTRRAWLAWPAAGLLGACATGPGSHNDNDNENDRIVEVATGATLTPDEVVRRMHSADFALLGELHDNPHHHARRAALLLAIGMPLPVVAEHLPAGATPSLPAGASGDALRDALAGAGFDAKGWRWPLHEPLFTAVARAGHRLRGGNLDRDAVRRLARQGPDAMPAALAPWIDAARLTDAARAALEHDLDRGHCGHLGSERMPGMVAAQRGRDAAMAAALTAEHERLRAGGTRGPVLLLAGNGHVRNDYGVPSLLAPQFGGARVLSIGFLEPAQVSEASAAPYDIAWVTPAVRRDDPCKAFAAPPAAPTLTR